MNKIFTLFACAAVALGARAAAPELLFRDAPVESGSTLQAGYTVDVDNLEFGGVTYTTYNYKQDTHLSVRGDKSKAVTVHVTATSKVLFCGITNQCIQVTDETRTNNLSSTPGVVVEGNSATAPLLIDITTDDMDGIAPDNLLKEVTVNVTVWYNDSPSEKSTVTVNLLKVPDSEVVGSVISPDADPTSVKYNRGVIDYTVVAPAKLEVYSTSGALMISRVVSATGSVSLQSLRPGVYIYSLAGKTGKIIR